MMSSKLKYLWVFLVAILVFPVVVRSQGQPERVLIVASCAKEKECGDVSIHRFGFRGGRLVSQEIVQTIVTVKGYFQGRENRIINNRFAVSGNGAVFDLQTKEMYDDKLGMLVGVDGNDLFINQINLVNFSGSSTYRFDLETKKYSRYPRPNFYSNFGPPEAISPDGKKVVWFEGITSSLFVLTKKGRHPSDFSSFNAASGYKATCRKCESRAIYNVPSVWVDNDRFITQRENGSLVLFDYRSRKWTDVVKIPMAGFVGLPQFFSDSTGGIYYDADKLYKIDVANKRYTETDEFDLGHSFKLSGRHDVKVFSFEDKRIASFISGKQVATHRYLAVEFQEKPLAHSKPIGIRVWGADAGSWTAIRIKYSPRIIGWLTE